MPRNILDVDESIIKKNLLLPETKKDDADLNNFLKTLESPTIPSVTFKPIPGVCVKTKTDKGEKVFINICQTTEIPAPEEISEERFYQILDEDPPTWCIPMSVGHERFEASKDGTQCLTYDIAINCNFFKKIQTEKHFFLFTILTVISAIEEKHEKSLDSKNYVVLKHRKVTGTLHEHRVQKRAPKKPEIPRKLIEEIAENRSNVINEKSEIKKQEKLASVDESQYVLLRKPKLGIVEKLLGFFKLPTQILSKDISISINQDRIVIDAPDFNYFVDIFVPYFINQDEVTARMDPNFQVLQLDMPVLSS